MCICIRRSTSIRQMLGSVDNFFRSFSVKRVSQQDPIRMIERIRRPTVLRSVCSIGSFFL